MLDLSWTLALTPSVKWTLIFVFAHYKHFKYRTVPFSFKWKIVENKIYCHKFPFLFEKKFTENTGIEELIEFYGRESPTQNLCNSGKRCTNRAILQKNCFILVYMFWYIRTFTHVLASFSMKAQCLASLHLFSRDAL
jgi:hypothetical protein